MSSYVARLAQAVVVKALAEVSQHGDDALDHVERRVRQLPRRRRYDVYHGRQAMDTLCAPSANLQR